MYSVKNEVIKVISGRILKFFNWRLKRMNKFDFKITLQNSSKLESLKPLITF